MRRLLLVRHGQTAWNAERVLQGQADIPLSPLGREQAQALAPVVAALGPERALASDLARARETADLLEGPRPSLTAALREIDVGAWQGERVEALAAVDPEGYAAWRAGHLTPPGGEAWDAFRRRAAEAVEAAAERARTLLVVTHGGVIRALLQHALDLSPSRIVPVAPASLTILRLAPGKARLELFNYRPGVLELEAPD